ncbi:MAG: VWA domain-containing protein [Pseudomonadales bacterium]|nr:VWA domain-containing protein [Pseudomonadales bacterium]
MTLARFEAKFSVLDLLPESLYSTVVTHHHGELITRVHGILQWRSALLLGELPEETQLNWPDPELARTLLMRMETLELASLCYQQEALTDRVLIDICEGISSAEDFFSHKPDGFVDKQAQRQRINSKDSSFRDEEGLADHVESSNEVDDSPCEDDQSPVDSGNQGDDSNEPHSAQSESAAAGINEPSSNSPAQPISADDNSNAELNESDELSPLAELEPRAQSDNREVTIGSDPDTQSECAEVLSQETPEKTTEKPNRENHNDIQIVNPVDDEVISTEALESQWKHLVENWRELSSIYKEIPGLLGSGWDLTPGQLRSGDWRSIIQYQKRLRNTPELKQMANSLGRNLERNKPGARGSEPKAGGQSQLAEVITPRAIMEAGGIERSDSISRMLPAESALLGHPKLKMLWHAKRAEHLLMSYKYSGFMIDNTQPSPQPVSEQSVENRSPADGAGPIIICLDTSGSMQGEPEQIAKAICLEVIRIARVEKRACQILSFGSQDELIEYELSSGSEGLANLLEFIQHSFHGGTDLCEPLLLALKKQQQQQWRNADILLLSDGRFPVQEDLFENINRLKKNQGLRIHGILLGNWRGGAMEALSDPMHRFTNWNKGGI